MDIWGKFYNKALRMQNARVISPFIEAGSDTASTLGMYIERNAIVNMITNGEHAIDKLVTIVEEGSVGSPCGACREYMM